MKLFVIFAAILSSSVVVAVDIDEIGEYIGSWFIESVQCFDAITVQENMSEKILDYPDNWTRDVKCLMRCLVVGSGLLGSDEVKYSSIARELLNALYANETRVSKKAMYESILNCYDSSIAEDECERAGQFMTCLLQLTSFHREIIGYALELSRNPDLIEKYFPGGVERLEHILENPEFKNFTLEFAEMRKEWSD